MNRSAEAGRQVILVLGMHRSGTSAVATALESMGWSLGRDVLPTQPEINARGFGENAELVACNEALFKALNTDWYELRDWSDGWLEQAKVRSLHSRAAALLTDQFPNESQIVLKDPRLCLTLPFWLQVLEAEGCDTRVVRVLRHPTAVADSLAVRDQLPERFAYRLWLMYVLQAERHSSGLLRATVNYADLLAGDAAALKLFDDLAFDAAKPLGIDPTLNHHEPREAPPDDPLLARCLALFDALCRGKALGDTVDDMLGTVAGEAVELPLLNELLRSHMRLAAETARIGALHSEAQDVVNRRDKVLADSGRHLEALSASVTELNATVDAQNAAHKELEQRLHTLEAALHEKGEQIAEVTRYAKQCEAVVATKDEEIAEVSRYAGKCEAMIQRRDGELAESTRRASEFEVACAAREERIEELLEEVGASVAANAALKCDVEGLTQKLGEGQAACEELEQALHALQERHSTQQETLARKTAELERSSQRADAYRGDLEQQTEALEAIRKRRAYRLLARLRLVP
ncbi:MAG: hypothetical protein AAGH19_06815 [Pseudomonadota bacterium]